MAKLFHLHYPVKNPVNWDSIYGLYFFNDRNPNGHDDSRKLLNIALPAPGEDIYAKRRPA
jgi:hypothetical protein